MTGKTRKKQQTYSGNVGVFLEGGVSKDGPSPGLVSSRSELSHWAHTASLAFSLAQIKGHWAPDSSSEAAPWTQLLNVKHLSKDSRVSLAQKAGAHVYHIPMRQ